MTPNHFLLGQMGGQFAPESELSKEFHPRKRLEKGTAFGFFGVAEMAQGMFTIVDGKTEVVGNSQRFKCG